MNQELATIEDIHFGLRDTGAPCIWFTTKMLCGESLQVISDNQAIMKFVEDAGCCKLEDLEGKPCVVETDGLKVRFVRLHK